MSIETTAEAYPLPSVEGESDRELLELAAKAAGIEGPVGEMCGGELCIVATNEPLGMWAPLTDDGDALRLAVKLNINAGKGLCDDAGGAIVLMDGKIAHFIEQWKDHGGDRYAATRRAIVRAAAALAMKEQPNA